MTTLKRNSKRAFLFLTGMLLTVKTTVAQRGITREDFGGDEPFSIKETFDTLTWMVIAFFLLFIIVKGVKAVIKMVERKKEGQLLSTQISRIAHSIVDKIKKLPIRLKIIMVVAVVMIYWCIKEHWFGGIEIVVITLPLIYWISHLYDKLPPLRIDQILNNQVVEIEHLKDKIGELQKTKNDKTEEIKKLKTTLEGSDILIKIYKKKSGDLEEYINCLKNRIPTWLDDKGTTGTLMWVIHNNVLTISGKGEMPYYCDSSGHKDKRPWDMYIKEITSIIIEDGITSVGACAFQDFKNLISVNIPDSVEGIGIFAFYYCWNLTSIRIPGKVKNIGNYAFGHCSQLKSVLIPNGVIRIGKEAFSYCDDLISVSIPASTVEADIHSFEGCERLGHIYLKNVEPPVSWELVDINKSTCILHVPAGSKEEYRNHEVWGKFKNIIEEKVVPQIKMEFVQYDISNLSNTENYPILKIPEKGTIIRNHKYGKLSRRGYKEEDFQKAIQKYFGGCFEVSGNVVLNIKEGIRPYEPDIAIIGKGIKIDIEIDEPYSGVDRKPTHCRKSNDIRNDWFTDRGWIVIRFSEYQVHTQELECLKYIVGVINKIVPGYAILTLNSARELEKECLWDKFQSEEWEKEKYREKYLGIDGFNYMPVGDIGTYNQVLDEQESKEEEIAVGKPLGVPVEIPINYEVPINDVNIVKNFIREAIEQDVNIKFNYEKLPELISYSNGERHIVTKRSLRVIKPFKIENKEEYKDSLCVDGFCYMRNADRTFRVERITNLVINPIDVDEYWEKEIMPDIVL